MIERIESFNHLMGLDMKGRNLYDGISPEKMRRRTPTTGVEEVERGKRTKMGFKVLETENLPVVRMVAKEPTITIRGNGQATISTAAAEVLNRAPFVTVHFDEENNLLGLRGSAKTGLKLSWPEKSKSAIVGLGAILRRDFPMYDAKAAGVQPFKVSIGKSKTGPMLVIKIPLKTPEYRAPVKRVKKVEPEAVTPEVAAPTGGNKDLEID